MSHPFVLFGRDHLTVLALTLIVPLLLAALTRRSRHAVRVMQWSFAAWLIEAWIFWLWMIFHLGWESPQTLLPMHLCDWATITTIVTLIRPRQKTYELAYFWCLCGTLLAMVTPDLAYDYPDDRFIIFFAFHGGVIAATLYLTFAAGMRPYPSSIPRVIAWTLFYAVAAATVDFVFKVNFGYLRAKPATATILDALAPWPWYIGELVLLGIVLIFVYYAPFFIWDRARMARQARA
ncbi:MAG TPA: TIGR02206 family membrane protein [Rhizomicrobium sp.]|nr:TIGR02206 family membrane protein [Rhizomicrobium sp.]